MAVSLLDSPSNSPPNILADNSPEPAGFGDVARVGASVDGFFVIAGFGLIVLLSAISTG